jgi:flavin-dependent dehydrogenase
MVVDRAQFPRDKVCGGWVTPAVLRDLQIDTAVYASNRVLQPISRFRVSCMGQREVEIGFSGPVSFGIRRCEFDGFLLRRSGAALRLGIPVTRIEKTSRGWLVNGEIETRMLVGAGGHFCPVARFTGSRECDPQPVVAQEMEFEMTAAQAEQCRIEPEVPELFFCRDLKGYGWCFRKANFLNVGLGRLDPSALPQHVSAFSTFLRENERIGFDLTASYRGHAYLLAADDRATISDGVLLIGDSAGLAAPFSGEGIRPAVVSGLLAAEVIQNAAGDYSRVRLQPYRRKLAQRLGFSMRLSEKITSALPISFKSSLARKLMRTEWFCRKVVQDWFLQGETEPVVTPVHATSQPQAVARLG